MLGSGTLGVLLVAALAHAPSAFAQDQLPESAAAAPAAPASRPTPKFTIGAKVYDPKGVEVGTIESMAGENPVVSTGTEKVPLPPSAFAQWPKGLVIGMTREELDAAAQKARRDAEAALAAGLKPGAEVRSVGGSAVLGTVKSVEGDTTVLTTSQGDVQLARNAYVMMPAGLALTFTVAQFEAALKTAKPQQ